MLITDAAVCVAVQEILAYIFFWLPLFLCPENNMFSLFYTNKFSPLCVIFENDLTIVFVVKYQKISSVFFIFAVNLLFDLLLRQMN